MDAVWMEEMAVQSVKWLKNAEEQWKFALVEVAVCRAKNKRKNVKKHETNQLYAMEWEYV